MLYNVGEIYILNFIWKNSSIHIHVIAKTFLGDKVDNQDEPTQIL